MYNKDEKPEQDKIVSERLYVLHSCLSLVKKFTGQQLQKTMHYHCKTIATQQTQSTSPAWAHHAIAHRSLVSTRKSGGARNVDTVKLGWPADWLRARTVSFARVGILYIYIYIYVYKGRSVAESSGNSLRQRDDRSLSALYCAGA